MADANEEIITWEACCNTLYIYWICTLSATTSSDNPSRYSNRSFLIKGYTINSQDLDMEKGNNTYKSAFKYWGSDFSIYRTYKAPWSKHGLLCLMSPWWLEFSNCKMIKVAIFNSQKSTKPNNIQCSIWMEFGRSLNRCCLFNSNNMKLNWQSKQILCTHVSPRAWMRVFNSTYLCARLCVHDKSAIQFNQTRLPYMKICADILSEWPKIEFI